MDVINKYIESYNREVDFHREVARICSEKCESLLESHGIRAIVTYRAKRPDRLKAKLEKRNEKREKKYQNSEEIINDIVDFAGVRIALYFPSDIEEVDRLISTNFDSIEKKIFPEDKKNGDGDKRFSGYAARHYRVKLNKDEGNGEISRYLGSNVEIQVASVLMHAWAEVEHDLVYKPLNGEISEDEYQLLDQLNGLVMSGEIALERIQKAVNERVSKSKFNNKYEFSSYLYNILNIKEKTQKDSDVNLGRTDVLFDFLKKTKLNNQEYIKNIFDKITFDKIIFDIEGETIAQKMIDSILINNPELIDEYQKTMEKYKENPSVVKNQANEDKTYFLIRWIFLESTVEKIFFKKGNRPYVRRFKDKLEAINFDEYLIDDLMVIVKIRHQIVHTWNTMRDLDFVNLGDSIMNGINKYAETADKETKEIIDIEKEIFCLN